MPARQARAARPARPKLTGRRVFKMAPLQHHFELAGWAETTIVVRCWARDNIMYSAYVQSMALLHDRP